MAKAIIYGNQQWAELVYFYLTHDSPHQVAAFTVLEKYIDKTELMGLPVVPFETVENKYSPDDFSMLVAFGFRRINEIRKERYEQAGQKGYKLISYISTRAVTWPQLKAGENCIVCESCSIQPFASIGNNVVIATGAVISHHSVISDHCFIAPGAKILGGATVEPNCFIGANATIRESVTVARDCLVGAGVVINKDTKPRGVYIARPPELVPKPSTELMNWHLLGGLGARKDEE